MLCAPAYSSSSSPMYLIKYLLNQQGIQSYNRRGKKSTYSSSSSIRRSYPSFSSSMSPKMSGAPPPREYDERLTPCFEPRCPDLRQRRARRRRRRKFMINWRNENKLKTAEHFQNLPRRAVYARAQVDGTLPLHTAPFPLFPSRRALGHLTPSRDGFRRTSLHPRCPLLR